MTRLAHTRTLAYYDVPRVIEAVNPIGGTYIAVYIGEESDSEYLAVGVPPEALRQFRAGDIDLLGVINLGLSLGLPLIGSFVPGVLGRLECVTLEGQIPGDFLPEPGYLLHAPGQNVEPIIEATREANAPIFSVTVEPPESIQEHRIRVGALGEILFGIDRLLKHAHAAWKRNAKEAVHASWGNGFDVVAMGHGSVQLFLTPSEAQGLDLFDEPHVNAALNILGELFEHGRDPERAANTVSKYKGHFAGAYVNMLDVLISLDSRIELAWTDPRTESISSRSLSVGEAKAVRARLGIMSELTSELVVIEGILITINMPSGTWTLQTEKGRQHGRMHDTGPGLDHRTTGERYRFTCREQMEASPSGGERSVLYATYIEEL